ncbi:MAG: hypothetical protein R2694_17600 [Ilumatobacteraceae bacterium]|nr:hypothetical protein [Ilumatobacter sp.]MCB0986109.1 hypothetical protein [Ilumatobacter sp.]
MEPTTRAIGLELIVADLDRAVELFRDVLGVPVVSRGPATIVTGEMAVVDLGGVVFSLLCPAADGDGNLLADRTPRLSQVVLAVDGGDPVTVLDQLQRTAAEHGLAAQRPAPDRWYLTPESVEGALGQAVAVVATAVPDAGPAPAGPA